MVDVEDADFFQEEVACKANKETGEDSAEG